MRKDSILNIIICFGNIIIIILIIIIISGDRNCGQWLSRKLESLACKYVFGWVFNLSVVAVVAGFKSLHRHMFKYFLDLSSNKSLALFY